MRVIKENTAVYESFFESLQYLSSESNLIADSFNYSDEVEQINKNSQLQKFSHQLQTISTVTEKINICSDIPSLLKAFNSTIRRIVSVKEAEFYFQNESNLLLVPVRDSVNKETAEFVSNANKDGILDWLYENKEPTIIPDTNSYTVGGPHLNYLIFPIIQNGKNRGVLTVLTPHSSLSEIFDEVRIIKIIIGLIVPRLQVFQQQEELKTVYRDVQSYQSKLSKDYKLSAIGELTEGIVERIVTPLQIILSHTDLLQKKYEGSDSDTFTSIKEQVKVIDSMINRLVKFSARNKDNNVIHSCDINEITSEYYHIVQSFFRNKNYECILDLENNLPTVLSSPDYIKQLLTNVFSIVKSSMSDGGGLLIQTKHLRNFVMLRIITTDYIQSFSNDNSEASKIPVFRILKNLMKIHDGDLSFNSSPSSGSNIILTFPLKRKIIK